MGSKLSRKGNRSAGVGTKRAVHDSAVGFIGYRKYLTDSYKMSYGFVGTYSGAVSPLHDPVMEPRPNGRGLQGPISLRMHHGRVL